MQQWEYAELALGDVVVVSSTQHLYDLSIRYLGPEPKHVVLLDHKHPIDPKHDLWARAMGCMGWAGWELVNVIESPQVKWTRTERTTWAAGLPYDRFRYLLAFFKRSIMEGRPIDEPHWAL